MSLRILSLVATIGACSVSGYCGQPNVFPLTNVVAVSVTGLRGNEREYSIEITNQTSIAELRSQFLEGMPITNGTYRLGIADYSLRFKMIDGSTVGAVTWRSYWEGGIKGFSGSMKEGWEGYIKKLIVPEQCERTSAQPDRAANGSQPIRSQTNSTSSAAGSRR